MPALVLNCNAAGEAPITAGVSLTLRLTDTVAGVLPPDVNDTCAV